MHCSVCVAGHSKEVQGNDHGSKSVGSVGEMCGSMLGEMQGSVRGSRACVGICCAGINMKCLGMEIQIKQYKI